MECRDHLRGDGRGPCAASKISPALWRRSDPEILEKRDPAIDLGADLHVAGSHPGVDTGLVARRAGLRPHGPVDSDGLVRHSLCAFLCLLVHPGRDRAQRQPRLRCDGCTRCGTG